MKIVSLALLAVFATGALAPAAAFAQTSTATMTTGQQMVLLIQLLQQLYALQLQLLKLQQSQAVLPVPAPTTFGSDRTPPLVSNFSSTVTQTAITIKWTTDEDAKSTVEWWAQYYRTQSWSETEWLKAHTKTISGLATGIVYTVRITARDGSGNVKVYPDQLVKTVDAPDKTKPTISNIKVSNITNSSAVITWKTNEKTKAKLYYGIVDPFKTSAATTKSITDTSLAFDHLVFLSNLENGRIHYFIIEATDEKGNKTLSVQDDFSTLWR